MVWSLVVWWLTSSVPFTLYDKQGLKSKIQAAGLRTTKGLPHLAPKSQPPGPNTSRAYLSIFLSKRKEQKHKTRKRTGDHEFHFQSNRPKKLNKHLPQHTRSQQKRETNKTSAQAPPATGRPPTSAWPPRLRPKRCGARSSRGNRSSGPPDIRTPRKQHGALGGPPICFKRNRRTLSLKKGGGPKKKRACVQVVFRLKAAKKGESLAKAHPKLTGRPREAFWGVAPWALFKVTNKAWLAMLFIRKPPNRVTKSTHTHTKVFFGGNR